MIALSLIEMLKIEIISEELDGLDIFTYLCNMKVINRTYKFRLYPNKEQETILAKHFGCVRFVYNYFLAQRKKQYEETKKSSNYYEQAKELTQLKKNPAFSWLREINSQTLQHSLLHLQTAYSNFFRGNARFPRFHSKKNGGSFSVPQHFRVEGGKIYLPKFNTGIKFVESRKIEGELRNMTVTVTPSGKYYVSIMSKVVYNPVEKTNSRVDIDLGLKDLAVTSDGERFSSNKFISLYARKLRSAQKHLSRKKKGSSSRNRQRVKVARIQEKISNSRLDKLHKMTTNLVRRYDVICCEDLNVKAMERKQKKRLTKYIADAGWGMFVNLLQYKAEWHDRKVVKVDKFYPSSKTCGKCGYVNNELALSDRQWVCPVCGEKLDRDLNASMNILTEGLRIISAGTVDYTDGEGIRLARKQPSVKSESHESLACG